MRKVYLLFCVWGLSLFCCAEKIEKLACYNFPPKEFIKYCFEDKIVGFPMTFKKLDEDVEDDLIKIVTKIKEKKSLDASESSLVEKLYTGKYNFNPLGTSLIYVMRNFFLTEGNFHIDAESLGDNFEETAFLYFPCNYLMNGSEKFDANLFRKIANAVGRELFKKIDDLNSDNIYNVILGLYLRATNDDEFYYRLLNLQSYTINFYNNKISESTKNNLLQKSRSKATAKEKEVRDAIMKFLVVSGNYELLREMQEKGKKYDEIYQLQMEALNEIIEL